MYIDYNNAARIYSKYVDLCNSVQLNSQIINRFKEELQNNAGFDSKQLDYLDDIREDLNTKGVEKIINNFYDNHVKPFI
jgi:hypothetical protein